jgi:hypothetical protein
MQYANSCTETLREYLFSEISQCRAIGSTRNLNLACNRTKTFISLRVERQMKQPRHKAGLKFSIDALGTHELHKDRNNAWIKMLSRLLPDIFKRLLFSPRRPIRAIGGQRIVDIRECEEPCCERNRIAAQPVGITGAIPAFMVPMRNVESGSQIGDR